MLLELAGLTKSYGNVHALRGLTANIDGTLVGLLGANGAGKSTLLKCMLGLIPYEGSATLLGVSCQENPQQIRQRVGYMPEADSYLTGLTAVELCTYAGELSGLPRTEALQRAHAALYYAGLEDKRYQKVDGYSQGLRQRVKLAQALVHDPDLLFLDEPTNGLDPAARDEMLELVSGLPSARDVRVVLSTHLLPDVDRVCDQVMVLAEGQLLFGGSIAALREQTDDAVFEVEVKQTASVLVAALRARGLEADEKGPIKLRVTLSQGAKPIDIVRAAMESGAQIRGLRLEQESLEEAFVRLVSSRMEA